LFVTHTLKADYGYILLRNNTQKIKNGNGVLFRFHFLGVGSKFSGVFWFLSFRVHPEYSGGTEKSCSAFIEPL
jgi:hypothetical protein